MILSVAKGFNFRKALRSTAALGILICIFLSPYLVRNYLVSGNFVPITNQDPWAFWGNSVTVLFRREAFVEVWSPWREEVWDPFGADLFVEVTGSDYSEESLYAHSEELTDRFSQEFLANLVSKPAVYLKNVAGNFIFYLFAPRFYPELLFWRLYSTGPETTALHWIKNSVEHIFSELNLVITAISLSTLLYFARQRSKVAKLGLILTGYFTLNYSIVFLDSRYLYSLLPVIWFCLGIFLTTLAERKGSAKISRATGIATGLFFIGQALPIFYTFLL